MIAIYLVGIIFTIIGLLYSIPKYLKIIKCRVLTKGIIVDSTTATGTGRQPIKAYYEYSVDYIKYKKVLIGQIINCILGNFFAIIGIIVLCIGIFLNHVIY